MDSQEMFSTRDIELATSLVLCGYEVENIDFQVEGEKGNVVGYFLFERTQNLIQTEKDFWAGRLSFEPKRFAFQQKSLKNRVINGGNGPHIKTRQAA